MTEQRASDDRPIPIFRSTYRTEECLQEIRECLESGWTGYGPKTLDFERKWCEYTGLPQAHFVQTGTAALHLAVKLLKTKYGWKPNDEIITTPITCVASNHPILYEGLKPIFADVDEYLCIDPVSLRERISNRTKAVMFVGLGGNTGQLEEVAATCRERGLKLILDGAHMAGTRLNGKHVGLESDAAVFSFQSVKNLPTAEGGMICFKEHDLDQACRKWTELGMDRGCAASEEYRWRFTVEHVGYKYQGNSVMAALGIVGLRYLNADNEHRRQICAWYDQLLDPSIQRVPVAPNCESSRMLYQVHIPDRDRVYRRLRDQGITTNVLFPDNTDYPMYEYAKGSCPRAAAATSSLLTLPVHLKLTYEHVALIASKLNEAVREASPFQPRNLREGQSAAAMSETLRANV